MEQLSKFLFMFIFILIFVAIFIGLTMFGFWLMNRPRIKAIFVDRKGGGNDEAGSRMKSGI